MKRFVQLSFVALLLALFLLASFAIAQSNPRSVFGPTSPLGPITNVVLPGIAAGASGPPTNVTTGASANPGFDGRPPFIPPTEPCYLRDGVMTCGGPAGYWHRRIFNAYGYDWDIHDGDVDDSVSVHMPAAKEKALAAAKEYCRNNPTNHGTGSHTYAYLELEYLWVAQHQHFGYNDELIEPGHSSSVFSINEAEYITYGFCNQAS